MFYDTTKRDHGLPHDPFKAIVAPRPIGWISTLSAEGVANLAPYSYFNAVGSRPDLVMFSSDGEKDTLRNLRTSGEFVANYVSADLVAQMNASSASVDPQMSEFLTAGLEQAPSVLVRPPRVAKALAALECKVTNIIELAGLDGNFSGNTMVIGQVVGVHIDEKALNEGRFDPALARPVARMGYHQYWGPDGFFDLRRPS